MIAVNNIANLHVPHDVLRGELRWHGHDFAAPVRSLLKLKSVTVSQQQRFAACVLLRGSSNYPMRQNLCAQSPMKQRWRNIVVTPSKSVNATNRVHKPAVFGAPYATVNGGIRFPSASLALSNRLSLYVAAQSETMCEHDSN